VNYLSRWELRIPNQLPRLRIGVLPALVAALSSVFKTRTALQLETMQDRVLRARTVVRSELWRAAFRSIGVMLPDSSRMAGTMVNMALPIGVEVSSASRTETKSMPKVGNSFRATASCLRLPLPKLKLSEQSQKGGLRPKNSRTVKQTAAGSGRVLMERSRRAHGRSRYGVRCHAQTHSR